MATTDEFKTGVSGANRDTMTLQAMRCLNNLRTTPFTSIADVAPIKIDYQISANNVIVHMVCTNDTQISLIFKR